MTVNIWNSFYVNWDWRNEYGSNRHSYEHYFSSSESNDFISTVIPVVQCLHTLPTVFPPLLQRVAGKVPVPICWKMNH